MEIYKSEKEEYCDTCLNKTKNRMWLIDDESVRENIICDNCFQELNRKIVDHLAEKNLYGV